MSMNSAARNSGDYDNEEAMAASSSAQLLAAASEGRGDEVVRILEADPELLRVGDPVGDTALHVLVRAGHVDALIQLIRFLRSHHHYKELLSMVAKQGNGHGNTPLHLVESFAGFFFNDDGDTSGAGVGNVLLEERASLSELELEARELFDDKDEMLKRNEDEGKDKLAWRVRQGVPPPPVACCSEQLLASMETNFVEIDAPLVADPENNQRDWWSHTGYPAPKPPPAAFADIEMEIVSGCEQDDLILDRLEVELNLIRHKVGRGNTILHEIAASGNTDVLTKLVRLMSVTSDSADPRLNLFLEGNHDGDTPLHKAVFHGHTAAARSLMEAAPEAAYQVNKLGSSPLSLALTPGQDDLVKYVLQVRPEASISPATRHALLAPHKGSLPHTAIRARNLTMLQMILGSIPCLIDSSDEKGWKPLSYAAFKGYLEEVRYLLSKFPESIKRFDGDGSLPIHKAVSGGHISIIKEFISSHPQSLSAIDKKGRSVLHIAVRYAKADILKYLIHETDGIQKIRDLRDHDGKTFEDYAKELKRN